MMKMTDVGFVHRRISLHGISVASLQQKLLRNGD